MEPNNNTDIDALVTAQEREQAAAAAARMNAQVEQARGTIDMLSGLGAEVQIVLHVSDRDEARNSIEIGPADARIKIYYSDLKDLMTKLQEAKEGKEEAARLGLTAPPKQIKGA